MNKPMNSVFLSHSSQDKRLVRRIAQALQHRSINVWIDEAELQIGDSLVDRIAAAIHQVDFVLAVISKHSYKSHWVQKELSLAMTREIEGKHVIVLPLLVHDVDVPLSLRDKLYADMRNLRTFDEQIDRIARAVEQQHCITDHTDIGRACSVDLKQSSTNNAPEIGTRILPDGSGLATFYAFQYVRRMQYQYGIVFITGFGVFILAMILASRSETKIVSPVVLTVGSMFMTASLIGFFAQHYISRAFDNDSDLVLALENASKRFDFFTRYRVGKGN